MNRSVSPCNELFGDIARWQRDGRPAVTIAVVSAGSADANRASGRVGSPVVAGGDAIWKLLVRTPALPGVRGCPPKNTGT